MAKKTYLTAILICIGFLMCGAAYVKLMMNHSEKANMQNLYEAAERNRQTLVKHIRSNQETLEGIAVCIGDMGISDETVINDLLRKINSNNSFIRMGLANRDGMVDLFDIDGTLYQNRDISAEAFFQEALSGQDTVSNMIKDFADESGYICYYGVPVYKNEEISSVLCAVNFADSLRTVVDVPVLSGKGFTNIVDRQGNIVLRSLHGKAADGDPRSIWDMGDFTQEEAQKAGNLLASGETGSFYYRKDGEKAVCILQPVELNEWVIMSVISDEVLKDNYNKSIWGTSLIIAAACMIFLFLISRQGKMMNQNRETLLKLAYFDELAGCRNFPGFLKDAELLLRENTPGRLAVWYCDLKNFKYYNDIFGYSVGDQFLKNVVSVIREESAGDEIFCRVSADNFVGLKHYDQKKELEEWFGRLLRKIGGDGPEASGGMHVELCMGFYCISQGESLTLNDMVNRANMAQKSVKSLAGSQYAYFNEKIREKSLWETEVEMMGSKGLEKNEFVPYFQPKIEIQRGVRVKGAEVLARWKKPDRGLVPPDEFIPVFEKSGLIVDLDRYIFEYSMRWYRNYINQGGSEINLAVNVSKLGVVQEDFVDYYAAVKEKYRIPDRVIELEFTESILLEDDGMFCEIVERLRKKGFVCSLDDFGSGYSSLNMLKNLPIDVLKLDMLFLKNSRDIRRERIVVSHIIAMAKELRIKTIAEGVETMEQVRFLKDAGCDVVQGYVFSKPLPEEEFLEYCRRDLAAAADPYI